MESVEAKTKDIMPVAFEFKCVPFEGLKERPFKLRLSIITGDRPVLVLRIIQLEAVQEEMANEFRDLLVEKFKDSKVEPLLVLSPPDFITANALRGHLWKRN